MDDLISRQAAIDALAEHEKSRGHNYTLFVDIVSECAEIIRNLPSTSQWIPVKTRPMDEEERAEWSEKLGSEKLGYDIEYEEAVIYISPLPDDGQEVLTCSRYGTVQIDRFENDPDYGCFFEENGDMDGIVAWMPLPMPWRGEKDK